MSDDFEVEIKGLSELQDALEQMPTKIAKRGILKSLKAGSRPIEQGMVANAPKNTGFLAEHFGTKYSMGKDGLSGSAFIGPKGNMQYPAFASGAYNIVRKANGKIKKLGRVTVAAVARWLEFGTRKMAKKPFMTQAFETNKTTSMQLIIDSLEKTVQEVAEESGNNKLF